ncbi:hypothetical protein EF148_12020 [Stenotrophomonas maltophilia]|nr:hypothetical protein [Stenotrophomonas maltophilia]
MQHAVAARCVQRIPICSITIARVRMSMFGCGLHHVLQTMQLAKMIQYRAQKHARHQHQKDAGEQSHIRYPAQ